MLDIHLAQFGQRVDRSATPNCKCSDWDWIQHIPFIIRLVSFIQWFRVGQVSLIQICDKFVLLIINFPNIKSSVSSLLDFNFVIFNWIHICLQILYWI